MSAFQADAFQFDAFQIAETCAQLVDADAPVTLIALDDAPVTVAALSDAPVTLITVTATVC